VTSMTLDKPAWPDEDKTADELRVREAHDPSAVAETVSGKEVLVSAEESQAFDDEFEKV
jgi:hypothetical protein